MGAFPDVTAWSHREYGHRVGVFRVLDVLAKHGIRPTIALDALTAAHYPFLVRHCKERRAEFIGHGIAVNRMISSRMSADEERAYIRESIDAVARATARRQRGGWARNPASRHARRNCLRRKAFLTSAIGAMTSNPTA